MTKTILVIDDDEKLNSLLDAISEIYASIFGPDPIEYRKERGLIDFQEEMGILVQEVVGNRVGIVGRQIWP